VVVWKKFTYRCEVCGETFIMHMQVGVEGPTRDSMPSPFSMNCPNGCKAFCPVLHVDWHNDVTIEQRNAKNGEYVFLYDRENNQASPVKILNADNWTASTHFNGNGPQTLYLEVQEIDKEKLRDRYKGEVPPKELIERLRKLK
jgi:hypothetical protein